MLAVWLLRCVAKQQHLTRVIPPGLSRKKGTHVPDGCRVSRFCSSPIRVHSPLHPKRTRTHTHSFSLRSPAKYAKRALQLHTRTVNTQSKTAVCCDPPRRTY